MCWLVTLVSVVGGGLSVVLLGPGTDHHFRTDHSLAGPTQTPRSPPYCQHTVELYQTAEHL